MQRFDRKRDALAAADAQGDEAASQAVPAHRVNEFCREHRAGGAERVTMRHSAPFDIDDVLGKSELARNHNGDGRERLIYLDALDGSDVPAGALQRLPDRGHW